MFLLDLVIALGMIFKKQSKNRYILVLFFSFLLSLPSWSQTTHSGKIVAFHPSVGNAITVKEKKEYDLFKEYNDSLFESAQLVKYSSDSFAILIKTTTGQSFEKPAGRQELDAIYAAIEKVKPFQRSADDYVFDKTEEEERQKRINRSENIQFAVEVTLQIVFVFLEILAQAY